MPETPSESRRLKWIVGSGVAVILLVSIARFRTGRDRIPWRSTLDSAREEARHRHVPVFADFSASWCGPCQQMLRTTFADAGVEAALKKFVPVQVDIDAHPDLAAHYAPEAVPTLVLIDADGNTLRTETGALDADSFLQWLKPGT